MPEAIDITGIMIRASKERWCVAWHCSTCDANQMRSTFTALLAKHTHLEIASALAGVEREFDFGAAEWMLRALSDPWSLGSLSSSKLRDTLGHGFAGRHYQNMLEAKAIRDARRRAHDLQNDPDEVVRRREERKQQKAKAHQERLELKKLRDAAFRAQARKTQE